MKNCTAATRLQLNSITPLCVGDSDLSIDNLFPNLQEEQNWTVQRKKKQKRAEIVLACLAD